MVTNRGDRLALAIRALLMLAEVPRGMATSAEIGEALDAHPVVLRRILGVLKWDGIVESRAGQRGGWALALDPSRISLGRAGALAGEPDVAPRVRWMPRSSGHDRHRWTSWTASPSQRSWIGTPIRNFGCYEWPPDPTR